MDIGFLQGVYAPRGPYATVYLATSHASEDQAAARALRWRQERERLAGAGADDDTLAAIETVLPRERAEEERGRVVCAAGGDVLLDDAMYEPVEAESRWSVLPDLLPYLAERAGRLPYAIALVDREGADIVSASVSGVAAESRVNAEGRHPVTKVRGGEERNKAYQRRAEGVWDDVAERICAELTRLVLRTAPEVVVLAGDPRMRGLVLDHLDGRTRDLVVTTDAGGRAAGAAGDALSAEIGEAVREKAAERQNAILDAFRQGRGRGDGAVTGLAATVEALRRGQVETLILSPESRDAHLFIGAEPHVLGVTAEEVKSLGEDRPTEAPADAALLRAASATDAALLYRADGEETDEGAAATLRYTDTG